MIPVITLNGAGGNTTTGPQATVGQTLANRDVATWVPVTYDSSSSPLSKGVSSGLLALQAAIDAHPGPFVIAAYSLGSMVTVTWYRNALAGGPQANRLTDLKGVVTFGNPYRQAGSYAPKTGPGAVTDPGGAGIGGPEYDMTDTPDWWQDYAHTGDLYTCCPTNQVGADVHILFLYILNDWSGESAQLWEFAQQAVKGPLAQLGALLTAVADAIAFYAGGLKQHNNYDATAAISYLTGVISGA